MGQGRLLEESGADQSVAGLDQKQLIAARNMLREADLPVERA
jgi:hypothetical protein